MNDVKVLYVNPQSRKILEYLRTKGGLTTLDAWTQLQILSPAKRIQELRNGGFNIETEWRTTSNGKRYGVYVLHEEGREINAK